MGVVASQMAVEAFVDDAFASLLKGQGVSSDVATSLLECIPDRSLMDRRTRKLWTSLTGNVISKADDWSAYHRHIERRNRVVHDGARMDADHARESLETCIGLIRHMQKVLGVYRPMPKSIVVDPTEEITVRFGHLTVADAKLGCTIFHALDEQIVGCAGPSVSPALRTRAAEAASRPIGYRATPERD
jgi:hypothetical protein